MFVRSNISSFFFRYFFWVLIWHETWNSITLMYFLDDLLELGDLLFNWYFAG